MDHVEKIQETPGLVPVSIHPENGEITWFNLATYHMYEGSFRRSLQIAEKLNSMAATEPVITSIEVLDHLDLEQISPDLMIFHMSRCGSTLLARALAQNRENNVFGEPTVFFGLWLHSLKSRDDKEKFQARATQLLSALLRKRIPEHKNNIVKFSSFETCLMSHLMDFYPESNAVFVYRHPIEVLVSLSETPPRWLQTGLNPWKLEKEISENKKPDEPAIFAASMIENMCNEIDNAKTSHLQLLHYPDIIAGNLDILLKKLGLPSTPQKTEAMRAAFSVHSKQGIGNQRFLPDSGEKLENATDLIRELFHSRLEEKYEKLRRSNLNIF